LMEGIGSNPKSNAPAEAGEESLRHNPEQYRKA